MLRDLLRFFCLAACAAALLWSQNAAPTVLDRVGHSQHGAAFDTGPRQKPRPMTGIGEAHFPITTKNPEVQRWFDQGNALLHSFADYDAERAFRWCLKLEPGNAMAYWGLARASMLRGLGGESRPADMIREALKRAAGNKSQAARLLGLSRNALRYRLSQMGLE